MSSLYFYHIPLDIVFVVRGPQLLKFMHFKNGCSEGNIQWQLVQVNRGEEVSNALILSQTQEVLLSIKGEGQRWSEGDKALLIFRGWVQRGGPGGDRGDGSR